MKAFRWGCHRAILSRQDWVTSREETCFSAIAPATEVSDIKAGSVAEWMKGAVEHKGSWWPDWRQWLEGIDAEQVPARAVGEVLPPIEDAPGSYVRVRA